MEKQRTLTQNNSLHLYFTQVSELLNEAGLDIKKAIPNFNVDIPWTPKTVKEIIWRTIQKAQLQKVSTAKLTTAEVSQVFDTVNRFLATLGLHSEWPSIETYDQKRDTQA